MLTPKRHLANFFDLDRWRGDSWPSLTANRDSKISGQEAVSNGKAETIYRILNANPEVYQAVNHKSVRSRMNICFRVKDAVTEKEFLEGAEAQKLLGLKGHRVRIFGIQISSSEPSFESKDISWERSLSRYGFKVRYTPSNRQY